MSITLTTRLIEYAFFDFSSEYAFFDFCSQGFRVGAGDSWLWPFSVGAEAKMCKRTELEPELAKYRSQN